MKVRACVTAAAIATGLCWSPATRAQEAAPITPRAAPKPSAPGPSTPPSPETPRPPAQPAVDIVDAARFFSAPRALGDAWERAVQAVLDGMRAFLEADRAAAQQALSAAPQPKRVPAWQTAIAAPRVVREARRPVTFQPVTVEPVTQAVADVRGQRAILLGAVVELPWTVP